MTILLFLCAVFCFISSPQLSAKALEFLYINANEGTASGGHVALRFEKETFHFQHYDGGIIRIVRDLNLDFDYQYRYLENRSFYVASVDLTSPAFKQLHEYFTKQFFLQKQQDKLLKELNRSLLFFKQEFDHPLLSLQGAGLFNDQPSRTGNKSSAQSKLLRLFDELYGDDFLHKKQLELSKKKSAIPNDLWQKNRLLLSDALFVNVPYSFASQTIDISNQLLFLDVISQGFGLNEKNYFTAEGADFKLSKTEIAQLKIFQTDLLKSLTRLVDSNRPDWGKSAFALYARILSLELSIQSGQLVFLDSFKEGVVAVKAEEVIKYKTLFQAQNDQALSYLKKKKQQLFTAKKIKEKDYSLLEVVSNYYHERQRGLNYFQAIRVAGEKRLAVKTISFPEAMYPELDKQEVIAAIKHLEDYKQKYKQQIIAMYAYNIFSRNCVTEVFRNINQSGIDDKTLAKLNSQITSDFATFIPFRAFDSLAENTRVIQKKSFREQVLEKMYADENDVKVFLREFNTLSAIDYKFNERDSVFLFFTSENIWSRPLLGVGNLLTAAGYSIYGGLALPFDSGKALRSAGMGAVMSLPELVFFNIRKGSYQYLLPLTAKNSINSNAGLSR